MTRAALLLLLLVGCGTDHRAQTFPRRVGLAPGDSTGTESPIVGTWRDNAAQVYVWSPQQAQVVLTGVEFWRYPPLQGEKRSDYIVLDGHFVDSTFISEGIAYRSMPESCAATVTVTCALHWASSVATPTFENVDSFTYAPAIVGTANVGISGGLWGVQTNVRPVSARRDQ